MRFQFSSLLALAVVAGVVATSATGAVADEYTVSMKGRSFSPNVLRIQPGDTIRFVNDDDVDHDVYSLTRGHLFTSGLRAPGRHAVFVFNRPGAFEVLDAARHDTMRLRVEVATR